MPMPERLDHPNTLQRIYLVVVTLIVGISGLILAIGGAWLLSLGGSWYYLVTGIGLVLSAAFLVRAGCSVSGSTSSSSC